MRKLRWGLAAAVALLCALALLWMAVDHRVLLLRVYAWLPAPALLAPPATLRPGLVWQDDSTQAPVCANLRPSWRG